MTIIHWDGHELPEELRALPPGDYAVQAVKESLDLSTEEEEGLLRTLESLRSGRGIDHGAVRERILRRVRP